MMFKSDSLITVIYIVNNMSTLSQQYNRYVNVFFEENVDKLSSH